MSVYVDRFIKQHKEYFKRNESFIKSNNWNNSNKYKQELKTLKNQLSQISKTLEGEELEQEQERITDAIAAIGTAHQKTKTKLFHQETELTASIVSRLKSFVQTTEKNGDRSLDKVQKFIDFTVSIINLHIKKCDNYLNYQMDSLNESGEETDAEIELKGEEIKFQDDIFSKKIKIQDVMDDMNLDSSTANVNITFFKNEKASLVLKEALARPQFHEIKEKVDSLAVDWNVRTSKQMFINMNPKDIPRWNPEKHFFDQDPVVLQFWSEEMNKIRNGVTINGYFVHPWLYFHLNFFRTPIPQPDGSEPPTKPDLRDNEWFFAENLKNCISEENPNFYSKAMLVYGTRRFGKSVILASLAHWKIITKYYSKATVVGGSSSDLNALTDKIQTSMAHIELPFKLNPMKQNWDGSNGGETTFGIKQDASTPLLFSSLIVQNLEEGAKKSKTQKTAGGAPSVSIYDEIGKYSFLKAYLAALPSFATPYGFKCVTVLAGTGGEADLSADAVGVLSNPELYDLLPMNWDLLENHLDPEEITWKKRTYATFFPGQMAYEKGFVKEVKNFGEWIENDDEEFKKLNIHVTNWKKNSDYLDYKIEEAKKDKSTNAKLVVQQRKVQYPRDPEDTFMSGESNKFPTEEAQSKKKYLEDNGIEGRKVFLYKSEKTGRIDTIDASNKELPEFPYQGGFIDAPILIYEEPLPNVDETYNLYIAGLDDYNLEESDGDSVGSFCVYKRSMGDLSEGKIVAIYNARPDPHRKFHEQGRMLLEYYNAQCYMENADTKFKDFLDLKHLSDRWLVKGFDQGSEYKFDTSSKRKYGWQPTESNVKFMMGRLLDYCEEIIEIEQEDGTIKTIKGVERIDDIGVLNEIIGYKKDGNFDRLRSFGSCLMYDLYLTSNWQSPKIKEERPDPKTLPYRPKGGSLFSNNGKKGFF
jgi:hypothetical protein